jgi:intracellular septation protein A
VGTIEAPTPVAEAPPTPRSLLREAAPRMLRDTLGPLVAFYVGWKVVGLAVGVLAALVAGLGALWLARREGRPGAFVRVVLAIVVVRAVVGLIGHSTTVYLAQDAAIDVALGSVFLGSLALGRPVAVAFAADVYSFPDDVRDADIFVRVFARITLVWGVGFMLRAVARLAVLLTGSVDRYVVFAAIIDVPFLLGLLAWSIRYSVRAFRGTEEWERLFGPAPAP